MRARISMHYDEYTIIVANLYAHAHVPPNISSFSLFLATFAPLGQSFIGGFVSYRC